MTLAHGASAIRYTSLRGLRGPYSSGSDIASATHETSLRTRERGAELRGHGKQGFRAGTAIETGVSGGPPLDCCKRPPAAALFRRTSQVRLDPPGYSGLRGEGSIPVPLPPPPIFGAPISPSMDG